MKLYSQKVSLLGNTIKNKYQTLIDTINFVPDPDPPDPPIPPMPPMPPMPGGYKKINSIEVITKKVELIISKIKRQAKK